jgi:short-subunit dehydrogenase
VNHAVITGAAGAIGAALAAALRRRWPDAALTLVDRDADGLARTAAAVGGPTHIHLADLADVDALPAHVDAIAASAAGPIDGLVNCAGIMWIRDLPAVRWPDAHALLAIDLLSPLRLQDLVLPAMIERRRGVIVNVASMAGKVPLKGCAYYGASKAGLAMASEVARAELAPHGIRVVTVYPGPVRSPLEQAGRDGWGGGGALGRVAPIGEPDELARRIVHAVERDEPRVIYPRVYNLGWSATPVAQWLALSYGPAPVA